MFKQEQLATAALAQVFGSELLKIQKTTTTDSGQQPQIVNIDPRQFLVNQPIQNRSKIQEKKVLESLQREAEAMCPLPQQTNSPIEPIGNSLQERGTVISQHPGLVSTSNAALESIAESLAKIVLALEDSDITIKKKNKTK